MFCVVPTTLRRVDSIGDVWSLKCYITLSAKTARNDNSSRFGKLFQIYYDNNGEKLITAELCTYLLAKSRVVQVPNAEENYHVFHTLQAGDESTLPTL